MNGYGVDRTSRGRRIWAWLLTLIMVAAIAVVPGDGNGIVKAADSSAGGDLAPFFSKVEIFDTDDNSVSGPPYHLTKEGRYKIKTTYTEHTDLQFETTSGGNHTMTYIYPNKVTMEDVPSDTIDITVSSGGIDYIIHENPYSINDNTLTITFNKDDVNYQYWQEAQNGNFYIEAWGNFSDDEYSINWGAGEDIAFDVEGDSKVSVDKLGYENSSGHGNQHYEITVTSVNTNNNVVVTDTLSGAGYAIDYTTMKIKDSSNNDVSSDKYELTQTNEESFILKFNEMTDGEKYTIVYDTKLTEDGQNRFIVLTGKNNVTVSSDDDAFNNPDGGKHSAETDTFTYNNVSVKKSNENASTTNTDSSIVDGQYRIAEWKVVVNEEADVPAKGVKVTDVLKGALVGKTEYDGVVTVEKRDKDGNVISTSTIGPGTTGWEYVIDDTEAYKYTFTYKTKTDISSIYESTDLKNTVTAKLTDDVSITKDAGIGLLPLPGQVLDVKKSVKAVNLNDRIARWTVKLTVPKNGLDSAVVEDTPNKYSEWSNELLTTKNFFDTFDKGSVQVTGLKDGESYEVDDSKIYDSTDNKFVITFYKTVGGVKTEGLYPSGDSEPRTITITYQTVLNEEWLEKENSGYTTSGHTNKVAFVGNNGTPRTATAKPEIRNTAIDKRCVEQGSFDQEWSGDPTFYYAFYAIDFSGAEAEGDYIFTDKYDSKYLNFANADTVTYTNSYGITSSILYPAEYTPVLMWANKSGRGEEFFSEVDQKTLVEGTDYTVDSSTGTITFNIKDLPLDGSNNPYYWYRIQYALITKPDVDYDELNRIAAQSENCDYVFVNTVTSDEFGTAVNNDFTYSYNPVEKTLTNKNFFTSHDGLTRSEAIAEFSLVINPGAYTINGGGAYKVTDTPTNLSVDYDSITFTPSQGVSFYPDNGKIIYTVPDSTKVTITYKAKVISDQVNFTNTASVDNKGKTATASGKVNAFHSGGGSGSILQITIAKFQDGDYRKGLQGAVFQLFDANKDPMIKTAGPHKDEYITFTTGADGKAVVRGNSDDGWGISEDTTYYLKEIIPPEGYTLDDTYYEFTIKDEADYSQWIYYDNDILTVRNSAAKVQIEKQVVGDGKPADNEIPYIFNFKMVPVTQGAPMPDTASGNQVIVNNQTVGVVDFGQIVLHNVTTTPYIYKITEEPVSDSSGKYLIADENEIYVKVYADTTTVKDENGNNVKALNPHVGYYKDAACTEAAQLNSDGIPFIKNSYSKTPNYKLEITKTGKYNETCSEDAAFTKKLTGVEFTLYDDNGDVVAVRKTTSEGRAAFTILDPGTYTLKETATVGDYILSDEEYTVIAREGEEPVLKSQDGAENKRKVIVNDVYRADIKLLKVNESDTGEKLPSSTYGLYKDDANGNPILIDKETTDKDGVLSFKGVLTGVVYTIKELEAPDGFYVSEKPIKVAFKVTADHKVVFDASKLDTGNGTITVDENGNITWLEPIVKATFAKVDEEGNPLAGATLHVEDSKGNIIDSWTSTTSLYSMEGKLNCGETYKLVEDEAPDGYEIALPVTFEIDNEMGPDQKKIVTVSMTDKKSDTTTEKNTTETTTNKRNKKTTDKTSSKTTTSKRTGDEAPIADVVIMFVLSLAGLHMLWLRRRG